MRNLSQKSIENIRRGLRRSWQPGGTHRIRQRATVVDADTHRERARFDAKGTLLLSGTIPRVGRVEIYRSTNRCTQFDVFLDGRKDLTGGRRKLADWIDEIASI